MLRSLWSGVSGIQAHQVGIDIEGNNIANVNTVGFKYSRANFSDLLSQNIKLASAPQGARGGTNELQIGLGSKINSTTRIFQQGSIQNTDRPTDVAIQGDGFLVLTPDNGNTYRYTRNGDLTFDATGNLVDSNGLKVQGWLKHLNPAAGDSDVTSSYVDTTAPTQNILIEPGLRIPSKQTSYVNMKASLNSGSKIVQKSSIFGTNGKDGMLYSKEIDKIPLSNKTVINEKALKNTGEISNHNKYGYKIGTNIGIVANNSGDAFNLRSATFTQKLLKKVGDNDKDGNPLDQAGVDALNKEYENLNQTKVDGQGIIVSILDREQNPPKDIHYQFRYTNGDIKAGHPIVSRIHPATGTIMRFDTDVAYDQNDPTNGLRPLATIDEDTLNDETIAKDVKVVYFTTDEELRMFMQSALRDPMQKGPALETIDATTNVATKNHVFYDEANQTIDLAKIKAAPKFKNNSINYEAMGFTASTNANKKDTLHFNWQNDINLATNGDGKLELIHYKSGKLTESRPARWYMETISDLNTTGNDLFENVLSSLEGVLDAGSRALSAPIKVPSHASSIHIYDSLGARHSLRFEFTKSGSNTWNWRVSVPEPGVLEGGYPPDQGTQRGGKISFTDNGALKSFSPLTITFTGNNGSKPKQIVQIDLGNLNDFNGMSHIDAPSSSQGISQDGFSGGDLVGIRIDDVGTLVGTFSNSRSFALGQLALASFNNNAGLKSLGNNLFSDSSNSGTPLIGTAGTGVKGTIQASSLELSNVDLSKSLTQLIALQRGFQANGKTITTSDDLLQTLIQLKN